MSGAALSVSHGKPSLKGLTGAPMLSHSTHKTASAVTVAAVHLAKGWSGVLAVGVISWRKSIKVRLYYSRDHSFESINRAYGRISWVRNIFFTGSYLKSNGWQICEIDRQRKTSENTVISAQVDSEK